ncbi:MAG: transglutaminase family protein [Thermodesulfobacteriota bacterium]|nr:transglutaminase family protein [Thermodesulfobacteriota bacterium]
MDQHLSSTPYMDFDVPEVMDFAKTAGKGATAKDRSVNLYYAVRDGFPYNPYAFTFERDNYKASFTLAAGEGFCIQKSILLAAAARALGIPAQLGFGNVINHLATERLKKLMGGDLFVFHGYTVLFIDGRWVKATPAFNRAMCEKFNTRPLEFDGVNDSVFHPYDNSGNQHMEYVHDYGAFDDMPFDLMIAEMRKYYPQWFGDQAS